MTNGNGLSGLQIHKVVDQYVGVTAGNLTGFSHRGLQEFYSGYCGLDVDLSKYVGNTKREIFLAVLKEARPHEQATILRALVERILPTGLGAPMTRTESLRDEILSMAGMLETTMVVPAPTLKAASEVVQRALTDAQVLLDNSDAISAIDRIHTAFHGYVISICREARLAPEKEDSLTSIFKALTTQHPKLVVSGEHREHVTKILQASSTIMDSVNTLRNKASMAHPTDRLLALNHASLVLNVCRSLLNYLDSELHR